MRDFEKDFAVDQRIQMFNTVDPSLENKYGTIVGRYHSGFYIVLLDEPRTLPNSEHEDKAIVLTEACIKKLSNGDN